MSEFLNGTSSQKIIQCHETSSVLSSACAGKKRRSAVWTRSSRANRVSSRSCRKRLKSFRLINSFLVAVWRWGCVNKKNKKKEFKEHWKTAYFLVIIGKSQESFFNKTIMEIVEVCALDLLLLELSTYCFKLFSGFISPSSFAGQTLVHSVPCWSTIARQDTSCLLLFCLLCALLRCFDVQDFKNVSKLPSSRLKIKENNTTIKN